MYNDFNHLTHNIIGCSMRVHSTLGKGYREIIYHRALGIEMTKRGLRFESEVEVPVYYDGIHIGSTRVDFIVEQAVIVELKAFAHVEAIYKAQLINYLSVYKIKDGLLINFGASSLQYHRLYNADMRAAEEQNSQTKPNS